jgi:hypothetical protein
LLVVLVVMVVVVMMSPVAVTLFLRLDWNGIMIRKFHGRLHMSVRSLLHGWSNLPFRNLPDHETCEPVYGIVHTRSTLSLACMHPS